MRRGTRREREWLDFTADALEAPLESLPDERIARLLATTLSSDASGFSSSGSGADRRRVWPPELFGERRPDVSDSSARIHPVLRYRAATGSTDAMQVAEVPAAFAEPWRVSGWESVSRSVGVREQVAVVLRLDPEAHRVFFAGRSRPYDEDEIRLARTVQRLLLGLDRQIGTLAERPTPAHAGPLSARELAVLTLVAEGGTASSVARRLTISERTVHKHLQRIYAKLGVSDRVSAVRVACGAGLIATAGRPFTACELVDARGL